MRWMRPAAMRWFLALFVAANARTNARSRAKTNARNATSRLVFGSCSKVHLPQPLWPWIRKRHPKAWIWAGDAVYGDRLVRAVPLTFEAMGPQYLRDAYARQNAIPEYARLREEVPHWIATWDDHDFGLNDGGGDLPWRDASQAVFLEAMGLTVPAGQRGVYTKTSVPVEGGSVLVVALDLRYHKSPYSEIDGDFLGEAQWAWLAETLQSVKEDAVIVVSSLQLLDERYGLGERWGRFPAARRRLLNVFETCMRPLLVISGDVHMAELSVGRCGGRTLIDFTSSGMTHAWSHQVRAGFSRAFAPVLTAAMASFQSIAPLEWQATDDKGRRMHYLDLNFGELDFDVAKGLVTARVFGVGKAPVLERAFSLRDLGVGGACRPVHGFLPPWRHYISLAVWALCLGLIVVAPLALAIVIARRCLSTGLTINAATVDEDAEVLTSARRVRREVFCVEQRVPVEMERDAHDVSSETIHVVASYEDFSPWDVTFVPRAVGAARIVVDGAKRKGKIGRVCVLRDHRRRGIGRRVVRACVDALRRKHPGYLATLGSQVHAVGFYESLGFRCIEGEEPFMDGPGCLHRTMVMET